MKCSTSGLEPIFGIDFSNTKLTRAYAYESQSKIYILQLIVSSGYSPNNEVNDVDIEKFQSIIDSAN